MRAWAGSAGLCAIILVGGVSLAQLAASPWDERGPLDGIAAAARMYIDCPPRDILEEEELKGVLDLWDAAVQADDFSAKFDAVKLVQGCVPKGYRWAGCRVLRYGNPEIEDRVVDLYLEEHLRDRHALNGELTMELYRGVPEGTCNEALPDYQDAVANLAYSTFSPRIYAEVLDADMKHSVRLRHVYLASVNPETTLDLLLRTTRGCGVNGDAFDDVLYYPEPEVCCFGNVEKGFALLSTLCDRSPEVVLARRDEVIAFVRKHAKYYAAPRKVSYRPDPRYSWRRDYTLRCEALRVLEHIASANEIYMIQDIMFEPPNNPASGAGDEITKMGEHLIERLEALR